ncbi:MAG: glycoside hydrolase family 78 protein, partial [Phycisphaerae bacterium]
MGGLAPARLRCEYHTNPLGIDVAAPRLSWIVESDRRGARQTACQVLVASSEENLAAGKGDLWDTGKVASEETLHLAYAGKPLRSRMRCHWKVRAWDERDRPSEWSVPALWTMGLLEVSDWQAKWIGYDGPAACPHLRKAFAVERPVRRATVYATALGLYELRLNGRRVGRDRFTPGWTDYHTRCYYRTYDVTDLLRDGENVVGAILAPGWYAGHVGLVGPHVYGRTPWLLAQLEIEYADGSTETVATDKSWRAAEGPIVETDLLMGETHDARREVPGWDGPGFDAADWAPVDLKGRMDAEIGASPGVPVRVHEEMAPARMTQPKPGAWVFDFGQEFPGWVRLKVRGRAGEKVVLRFAEMLEPDGTVHTANLRSAKCTDAYVLRGGGEEVWEPRFTYRAFRYVEVTGWPGEPGPDALVGVVAHSAVPRAGAFECSNPLLNRLQENVVWTQRANFLEVPTDCPQRDERLGWTGDAQIFIRTATYNADAAAFFAKWLVDLGDAQRADGAFPDVAPLGLWHGAGTAAWGDAGTICPWTCYEVYGDVRFLERHYGGMVRWVEYLKANSRGLLRPAEGYGDWLSIQADTPKDVLATAYFALSTRLTAKAAAVLGRENDREKYEALFEDIQAAFNKAYVAGDGRIKGDTQTGYVLALQFDLLPDDLRRRAARHLVEDIKKRDTHLSTGIVGLKDLMTVLAKIGEDDVAYQLLLNDTFPSWGYEIKHGATTIWERWNGWTEEKGLHDPGMNSFCHYAFGAVGEWLFSTVAGIEAAAPGFKRIVVRPRPGGGLEWTRAQYESVHGLVASAWKVEGKGLAISVTIPANTTAEVHVPAGRAEDVT